MAYVIILNEEICDGNGSCEVVCPQKCFAPPQKGKAVINYDYDCIGCEGCVSACPKNAISIVEENQFSE